MKLYFSPGTCSLHPHIALREVGLSFELVLVRMRARRTYDGRDYSALNPKGYVPLLELDDGSFLTESAVIAQYIADRRPERGLVPCAGTMDRYRVQEWMHFTATEIHKTFGPLLTISGPGARVEARAKIAQRLDYVARELDSRSYLVGNAFTVADGYLFNLLKWTDFTGIDLARWPSLGAFSARVAERPSVREAVKAERAIAAAAGLAKDD